ncbi:MAG TPA: UvrD-helicase domain-containing protein [Acidobacteriaceae bacterium]|nr:UvrD-helicase domain-containing protein [Acidobacteriaceae bacterium]
MEDRTLQSAPERRAEDTPQRLAALDTEQSFIVEASAGSGKTELLIQRYLKLLAQVEEPEQILAITFTLKAASEMRDRILQELRDAEEKNNLHALTPHKQFTRKLAMTALENSRNRRWNLLHQPQRMHVRTIDSFCNEIVTRLPILTRMGAGTQPLKDASALYSAAASTVLKQLGGADGKLNDAIRTLLLHLDNRFERATQLLANLLATRDQWGPVLPIGGENSDEDLDKILYETFEQPLEQIHALASEALRDALGAETAAQVFSLIQYAAGELEVEKRKNPYLSCLSWPRIPPFDAEHAVHWKTVADFLLTVDGAFRKRVDIALGFNTKSPRKPEMKKLLESLSGNEYLLHALRDLQQLPPRRYTEQQRKVLRASFLLLRHALAQLKIAFARTGKTDFTELLLAAIQALMDDTNCLALSLGTRMRHLLVDEMQDTSVTQFHLLRLLVQSWDGYSQTVFLVGDPKQSIYRFRQAEVTLFAGAREGMLGIPLQPIFLTSNFRSQQSLVDTANQYFTAVFSRTDNDDGIRFEPSVAAMKEEEVERVHWHPLIYTKHRTSTENAANNAPSAQNPSVIEARTLCDVIEQYRAADKRNGSATSIAILVSKKKNAGWIFKALQERRIPYRAIEMDTLTDRQPLLDLLAITRCLLHAADRTAWLAVLRAPWCGLTLADLNTLCGNDDAQFQLLTVSELLRTRLALLSEDGRVRAERVWETMEKACSLGPSEKLATVVERTWHALGGPACIQPDDVPAVDQFLEMLGNLENEGGTITAARVEERMKKLFARALPSGGASVEVLTMHKAKGLEWDVVLLPGLHNTPGNDDSKLLVWTQELRMSPGHTQESQIFLAPIQHASEEKEPIGGWIKKRIAKRAEAETKRLLYVASTRARKELHLFGSLAKNEHGELAIPDKRSLLHVAWPFAEGIFVQQPVIVTEIPAPAGRILSMPQPATQPQAGVALRVAAGADTPIAKTIPLSNFRRLPSGWLPSPPASDVLAVSMKQVDAATVGQASAFLRPEGSWKARTFGTTVHALMLPLAQILRTNGTKDTVERAIQHLHEPALLRMLQGGYALKDARTAADRIIRVLIDVSRDPVAQWLLATHPNADSMLPDFEIPLTALIQKAVRSVRLDRMFLAGKEPCSTDSGALWIVDFKTAAHGTEHLAAFLEGQKQLYIGQMQVYAEVVRAAYPNFQQIYLGLYYPLLQQITWWMDEVHAPTGV